MISAREIIVVCLVVYSFVTRRPLQEPNNPSRIAAVFDGLIAMSWLLFGWVALSALCAVPMVFFGIIGSLKYAKTIHASSKVQSLW